MSTPDGYEAAIDWWALGVLVYELLAGHSPFVGINPRRSTLSFDSRIEWDPKARAVIHALLCPGPSKRLSSSTDRKSDIRRHLWFDSEDKHFSWSRLETLTLKPPHIPNASQALPFADLCE